VKSAGPSFVSQLNYLIPLWAVGVGMLFLGEEPEPNHLYALGLILCGILVTQLERRGTPSANPARSGTGPTGGPERRDKPPA
jgi:drug/metabolite transporter (DMT)-like permease